MADTSALRRLGVPNDLWDLPNSHSSTGWHIDSEFRTSVSALKTSHISPTHFWLLKINSSAYKPTSPDFSVPTVHRWTENAFLLRPAAHYLAIPLRQDIILTTIPLERPDNTAIQTTCVRLSPSPSSRAIACVRASPSPTSREITCMRASPSPSPSALLKLQKETKKRLGAHQRMTKEGLDKKAFHLAKQFCSQTEEELKMLQSLLDYQKVK